MDAEADRVAGIRIQLLGRFKVSIADRVVDEAQWRLRKAKSLVKLLALAPDHRLHREQVMDLLWRDLSPTGAANSFHQALFAARHALEPASSPPRRYLSLEAEYVILAPNDPLWIDVQAFERACGEARRSRDLQTYHATLDLYGGDLLPDDLYEDWARDRREGLRQEYIALLIELADLYENRHEYSAAKELLGQVLSQDALHETAHRRLMRLYALMGERQQAIHQYQTLSETLERELDTTPDAESQSLYNKILAAEFQTVGPPPSEPRHNLPVQLTSFIGRTREKREVTRLLATTRLMTLTGPGGCGKTRLALEIVRTQLDTYPDGVWFVEFASLDQPELVARAVAAVLDVQEVPTQSLTETLARFLKSKNLLLVLDNCEHLVDACARLADALLGACPDLRIVATSREPLRVIGELTWQVPSLILPDPRHPPPLDELIQYEAVRLFVERATAVFPPFTLSAENAQAVVQVCFRLDGIPLALELAAARVKFLKVEHIAARLDDRFSLLTTGSRTALNRQQTLRATIDWSYDLLPEDTRILFRRLSVFAGVFTLNEVEQVCLDEPLTPRAGLDLLARLVDRSLVSVDQQPAEERYRMLETIREYARQRLDEAGETVRMQARHRDWYIELVERANPNLWSAEQIQWLDRLETSHDNLRAALAWCVAHDPQSGLQLASALSHFWIVRGYLSEGQEWLEKLLATASQRTRLRAYALLCEASVCFRFGSVDTIDGLLFESLAIYKGLGDKEGSSRVTQFLGGIKAINGTFSEAKAWFEAGLKSAREADFRPGIATATHFLGIVAMFEGDYEQAGELFAESLKLFQELDDQANVSLFFLNAGTRPLGQGRRGRWQFGEDETFALIRPIEKATALAFAVANLGHLARAKGDTVLAQSLLEQSLMLFRAIQDKAGIAQILSQLGILARSVGDYERALALFEETLALRREIGEGRGIGRTLVALGNLAAVRGDYVHAHALLDEAMKQFQEMDDGVGVANTFGHLGNLAMAEGDVAQANTLYEKSLDIYRRLGTNHATAALSFSLAECARQAGNVDLARARLAQSLAFFRESGDREGLAAASEQLDRLKDAGN